MLTNAGSFHHAESVINFSYLSFDFKADVILCSCIKCNKKLMQCCALKWK